jgi:hypothetical protein
MIGPDRARVIRRAILVDKKSATIAIDKVGADPMVEIAPSEPKGFKALMHLGPWAKLGEWKADPFRGSPFRFSNKEAGRRHAH